MSAAAITPSAGSRRCYVRHTRLAVGEDRRREYKGHRSLSHEEIPARLNKSRRAVSRNINGFLNTGEGGKIYLGILDDGTVSGISLSDAQKGHVSIALEDLMGRYTPPVPPSMYRLSFVAVAIDQRDKELDSGIGMDGTEEECRAPGSSSRDTNSSEVRLRGHLLRSPRHCWCDRAARDAMIKGDPSPYYIIEISILPFHRDPLLPPMVLQLHPIYQNEKGCVYIRGSTTLQECTYQLITELTVSEVNEHFDKIKKRLRSEAKLAMTKLTCALADLAQQQSGDCHMTKPLPPSSPPESKNAVGLASL